MLKCLSVVNSSKDGKGPGTVLYDFIYSFLVLGLQSELCSKYVESCISQYFY